MTKQDKISIENNEAFSCTSVSLALLYSKVTGTGHNYICLMGVSSSTTWGCVMADFTEDGEELRALKDRDTVFGAILSNKKPQFRPMAFRNKGEKTFQLIGHPVAVYERNRKDLAKPESMESEILTKLTGLSAHQVCSLCLWWTPFTIFI